MGSAPRENSYTPLEQEMHIAPFFYKRRKVLRDFKENRSVHVQNEENVKNNENTNDDDEILYSMDYGFANGCLVEGDAVEKCFEDLSLNDSDITTDGPESESDFELVLDERGRFGPNLTHKFQLSDEEILAMLPRSVDGIGEAQALAKCRDDSCQRIASSGCQGYCTQHFCELYRQGKIEIMKNTLANTPRERMNPQFEDRTFHDKKRAPLDLRRERPNSSQGSRTHRNRKQVPMEHTSTRRVCAAPLCTKNVLDTEVCDRCSLKFQYHRPVKKKRTTREDITSRPIEMEMTAPGNTYSKPTKKHRMEPEIAPSKPIKKKPQDKWRCANPACDLPTNTKHSLCTRCNIRLMDANAEKVGMPQAEVLPVGCQRQRGGTEPRRMKEHERYRYHPGEQLGVYYDDYLQVERHNHRSHDVQKHHRHGLNQDPAYNGERYRDQSGAPYRTEVEAPPYLMRDVTNSSASEDDSSLFSFVSKDKLMRCKSTGCGNFGNQSCRGYCNSCFHRFS